jgi:hypothetical protein
VGFLSPSREVTGKYPNGAPPLMPLSFQISHSSDLHSTLRGLDTGRAVERKRGILETKRVGRGETEPADHLDLK